MGQKIRPTGFRVGVMIGWRSEWFASKQNFSELLVEDARIRKFIPVAIRKIVAGKNKKPAPSNLGISKVQIERTREKMILSIFSSRVGMIIGKGGENIDRLTAMIELKFKRRIEIKTVEIGRPETDAMSIANDIAEQLEKRSSFRRTMKMTMEKAMEAGAKGIKLQLSGRLGGAEMARCEKSMQGSVPLSTLRARIDYGFTEASTAQGNIGIKVWVNNGDFLTEESTDGSYAQTRQVPKKPARSRQR